MAVRKTRVLSPLHAWLVGAIRQSGVTQRELATRTGYSREHISRMMTGDNEGTLTAWSELLQAAGVLIVNQTEETT